MTKEEADKFAKDLGYSIHWRAGNGNTHGYTKDFFEVVIHLTINTRMNSAQLSGTHKMFTITSGDFSFPHKDFVSLFEIPLANILLAAMRIGT